jgi:hypothetical protein
VGDGMPARVVVCSYGHTAAVCSYPAGRPAAAISGHLTG